MTHARPPAIERALARFCARHRERVIALAGRHGRLADLAVTFPGLLFSLAVAPRGRDPRQAIDLVVQGAPLKAVAARAGIPSWVRKLPPEAFTGALAALPDGELFRRRIVNHVPRSPKLAPIWLKAVDDAARWGDEGFAVWIARELTRGRRAVKLERLRLLALYAWHSDRPDTSAHGLMRTAWHPGMRFATALEHARDWRTTVALRADLGEGPIDPWLEPRSCHGFDFVPLRSADDITEESRAMRNCARRYGYWLAHNRERLWSICRNGERVATLSIGFWGREPVLDIRQLKGRDNAEAPKEVWLAARQWINQQDLMGFEPRFVAWDTAPLDRSAWIDLWRPYWLAKRRIPDWLPLEPSRRALENL